MKTLQVLGSELPRSISLQAPTGRILSVPPVGERTAPHPALSPSDGEREKTRWQQGRARPLTPALSPSDGEREKRDCVAADGTDKMRPLQLPPRGRAVRCLNFGASLTWDLEPGVIPYRCSCVCIHGGTKT